MADFINMSEHDHWRHDIKFNKEFLKTISHLNGPKDKAMKATLRAQIKEYQRLLDETPELIVNDKKETNPTQNNTNMSASRKKREKKKAKKKATQGENSEQKVQDNSTSKIEVKEKTKKKEEIKEEEEKEKPKPRHHLFKGLCTVVSTYQPPNVQSLYKARGLEIFENKSNSKNDKSKIDIGNDSTGMITKNINSKESKESNEVNGVFDFNNLHSDDNNISYGSGFVIKKDGIPFVVAPSHIVRENSKIDGILRTFDSTTGKNNGSVICDLEIHRRFPEIEMTVLSIIRDAETIKKLETVEMSDIETLGKTYYGNNEKMELVLTLLERGGGGSMTHGFIRISEEKKIHKNNTSHKNSILIGLPTFAIPVEDFRSLDGSRFVKLSKLQMRKDPDAIGERFRHTTGSIIYSNEQLFGVITNIYCDENNFYLVGIPFFVIASVILNNIEKFNCLDIGDISAPNEPLKTTPIEWEGIKYNALKFLGSSCGHMPKIGKEPVYFCENDMLLEIDGYRFGEDCTIYFDKFKQYIPATVYCSIMCMINKNADKMKTFKIKYLKWNGKTHDLKEYTILPVSYDDIYNIRPYYNNVMVRIGDYVFIELSNDFISYLELKGIEITTPYCIAVNSTETKYRHVIFGNASRLNNKSIDKSFGIFMEKGGLNIVKTIDDKEITNLSDVYDIYQDCQNGLITKNLVLRHERDTYKLKKFIKI